MALIQSMEATGAKLFKYRGQIPVLIFVLAIPVLAASFNTNLAESWYFNPTAATLTVAIAILTSLCGLALRAYTVSTTPKGTSGRNTASQVANTLNTMRLKSSLSARISPTTSRVTRKACSYEYSRGKLKSR